jgi:hypothetical protein
MAIGIIVAMRWPNGGGHERRLPSQLSPLIVDEPMTRCLLRFDNVGYSSYALCNAERRIWPAHVSPDPTAMHRQHCDGSVPYIRRDKAAGQRVESGFARPIKLNPP